MNPWDPFNAYLLRVIALALDAAVEHPQVQITEAQYEELLLEANRRVKADAGAYPPAYPEALQRAAVKSIEGN